MNEAWLDKTKSNSKKIDKLPAFHFNQELSESESESLEELAKAKAAKLKRLKEEEEEEEEETDALASARKAAIVAKSAIVRRKLFEMEDIVNKKPDDITPEDLKKIIEPTNYLRQNLLFNKNQRDNTLILRKEEDELADKVKNFYNGIYFSNDFNNFNMNHVPVNENGYPYYSHFKEEDSDHEEPLDRYIDKSLKILINIIKKVIQDYYLFL